MRCASRARRPHGRLGRVALLASLALGIAAACGGGDGPPARVVIPQGSSFRAAADSLSKHDVVGNVTLFRVYAKLTGSDRNIKPGTYVLRRGSSWGEVLSALREGRGLVAGFTIPEGFSLAQAIPVIARGLGVPEDSVAAAVRDTALLRRLDVPTPTIEGYLFPDTYTFPHGTTARAAIQATVRRFEQVWEPGWDARLDTLAMSRHDLVTLASIVEKEARLAPERPVIAAVYLNRLRDGMLLQADPTVQYALGRHTSRVLFKHLETDSPYNTYRNKGLPPGPIASPGAAALRASLYPANVPYKFFVAYPDGHHEFRTTFAEHQVAVRAARQAWDAYAKARAARAQAAQGAGAPPAAVASPAPAATPAPAPTTAPGPGRR